MIRLIPKLRIHSVRARLTLWYTALLAAMLIVLSVGVHVLVRASLRNEIKKEFQRSLDALERVVRDDPKYLEFFDAHSTVDFFVVRRGEEFVYESEDWRNEAIDPIGFPFRGLSQWPWASPPERAFRFETRAFASPTGTWEIIMAQDTAPDERTLSQLTLNLLLASPAALILAMLAGYVMAGRVIAPVRTMAEKASQITAENLSERLPIENRDDEFGRLAAVFNETLARLEDSFERLRRFTADASHELRTPLTAIRTVGEVGLAEPFDSTVCRDAIASMLEETDRLARMVEGLLTLTRADRKAVPMKREPIRLFGLAEDVTDLLRVLAEEKGQTLKITGDSELTHVADRMTIRQAVMNLLDNAVRHTGAGGTIELHIARTPHGPAIEVRDQGPGIPPEARELIFERFYRVVGEEPSTENHRLGCGLGLAIARWAVEANGARLELDSTVGEGSTFRIVFQA